MQVKSCVPRAACLPCIPARLSPGTRTTIDQGKQGWCLCQFGIRSGFAAGRQSFQATSHQDGYKSRGNVKAKLELTNALMLSTALRQDFLPGQLTVCLLLTGHTSWIATTGIAVLRGSTL